MLASLHPLYHNSSAGVYMYYGIFNFHSLWGYYVITKVVWIVYGYMIKEGYNSSAITVFIVYCGDIFKTKKRSKMNHKILKTEDKYNKLSNRSN